MFIEPVILTFSLTQEILERNMSIEKNKLLIDLSGCLDWLHKICLAYRHSAEILGIYGSMLF